MDGKPRAISERKLGMSAGLRLQYLWVGGEACRVQGPLSSSLISHLEDKHKIYNIL
jgi:hypothetical protein